MVKAVFDDAGFPLAFYEVDELGPTAPDKTQDITLSQWQEFVSNVGQRKWEDNKVVVYNPPIVIVNAQQVTDTQFIQALAESKYAIISWSEAMDWGAQGILPTLLTTALDKITDTDTRNRAYMKARSAKSYIYSDRWVQSILPLLPEEVVAKMPGTDAQDKLQQLFNFAATL